MPHGIYIAGADVFRIVMLSSVSQLSRELTTPLTTPATRPDSLAIEAVVSQFRKLMVAVFGSGALAGLVLFAVQHFTVVPLIQAAKTYEAAGHEAHSGAPDEDEGWQPARQSSSTRVSC